MFFSAQKICAGYSRNRVVHHVSFSLERGCLMGILGANGSGKTTLVKALCGILPHEGTCLLENTELETLTPKQIAKLSAIFPSAAAFPLIFLHWMLF